MFRSLTVFATFSAACSLAAAASAATFVVTKTADTNDGSCAVDDCSLREAVLAANASPNSGGPDILQIPAGTYVLTLGSAGEDVAKEGDLDVTESLDVKGAGAGVTIVDGNSNDRIFHMPVAVDVQLSDLTLRGGLVVEADGGAISMLDGSLALTDVRLESSFARDDGSLPVVGSGGAIATLAPLTLTRVVATDNGADAVGGAVVISGTTLTVTASAFAQNASATGGCAVHASDVALSLVNSTVSGNTCTSQGAAIQASSGSAALESVTVASNSPFGLELVGATATLRNSLFAGNALASCVGSGITSLGHNLSDDASCALIALGDLPSTSAGLQPLADNGGSTLTHALAAGSPAIDAGDISSCPATDQRGTPRADGDGNGSTICDIGAYEFTPPMVPVLQPPLAWLLALLLAGVGLRRSGSAA